MKCNWKLAVIVLGMFFITGCAVRETSDGKDRENQSGSGTIEENGFVFEIDDVFQIGDDAVATGKVVSGTLNRGDAVILLKADGTRVETTAVKLEIFREELDHIVEGDNAGVYLADLQKSDIEIGDKLITDAAQDEK